MEFRLKLKDGTHVDLLFSMYFLNCACKLTEKGLTSIFQHLIGDVSEAAGGIVSGGLLDDLEVRAAVVAAGVEASMFAKGEYEKKTLVDGFELCEKVEQSLNSPQWGEIMVILTKSLIASLPKDEEIKKKASSEDKEITLDDVENAAIGDIGIIPTVFWHQYSFADYQRRAFYFYRTRNDEFKDEWERLRCSIHVLASVNGSKTSAKDLMPFSWDKEEHIEQAKPLGKEEVENILKRYNLKN